MATEKKNRKFHWAKISYFEIEPLVCSEGWKGVIELDCPAIGGLTVENFFVYDKAGGRIGLDHYYPEDVAARLLKRIRSEIKKASKKK